MTDVTGFGLMGHARELAIGSGMRIELFVDQVPRIEGALDAIDRGAIPAGLLANREFAECVSADAPGASIADDVRALLYDPQTAGPLLVSVAAGGSQRTAAVSARCRRSRNQDWQRARSLCRRPASRRFCCDKQNQRDGKP